MKILSYLFRKILLPACGIYTFITFTVILLAHLADSLSIFDIAVPALTLSLMLLFFVISIVLSLCNKLLYIKRLSALSSVFIHMLSVIFSVSVITFVYSSAFGNYALTIKAFLLVVIFTFLYIVFCLPFAIAASIYSRKERSSDENYVSIFSEDRKLKK